MSAFTPTGTKPMNAKILDGGASWKDRYKVADDLANTIRYCITFLQDGKEYCYIYSNEQIYDLLTNNSESFPIGSIVLYRSNIHEQYIYRIKTGVNIWEYLI